MISKICFNRVVMQNEEIDSEMILSEVENVVKESRNSLHIMDMLQCMRGYDDVTYVHSLNVALLSNVIGKLVFPKISEEDLRVLTLAGLLHDIGKMMIADDVLLKKDRLTIAEFNLVKTHVLHGNNILKKMNLDQGSQKLQCVIMNVVMEAVIPEGTKGIKSILFQRLLRSQIHMMR